MVTMIYVKVLIGKAPHGTGLTVRVVLEFQRKLLKDIIAIHMHQAKLYIPSTINTAIWADKKWASFWQIGLFVNLKQYTSNLKCNPEFSI